MMSERRQRMIPEIHLYRYIRVSMVRKAGSQDMKMLLPCLRSHWVGNSSFELMRCEADMWSKGAQRRWKDHAGA